MRWCGHYFNYCYCSWCVGAVTVGCLWLPSNLTICINLHNVQSQCILQAAQTAFWVTFFNIYFYTFAQNQLLFCFQWRNSPIMSSQIKFGFSDCLWKQLEMKPKRSCPHSSLKSVNRKTDSLNLILCHPGEYKTFLFPFLIPFVFTFFHFLLYLLCSLAVWHWLCISHAELIRRQSSTPLVHRASHFSVIKSRRGTLMSHTSQSILAIL